MIFDVSMNFLSGRAVDMSVMSNADASKLGFNSDPPPGLLRIGRFVAKLLFGVAGGGETHGRSTGVVADVLQCPAAHDGVQHPRHLAGEVTIPPDGRS